jgi:hypothetical protein
MPIIEWTPLKTNTLAITANKVDSATTSNAIALSIGKEKSEKKKHKMTKEKEDKEALDYNKRLELRRKITKK